MANSIFTAPINLPTGTRLLGPANVPDGVTTIAVRLARFTTATPTVWPSDLTTVDCMLQIDAGLGFRDNNGFTAKGGLAIRRDGSEATETTFTTQLPAGAGRRAQVNLIVGGGPLVSSLTVEVT
jgi:hypothetical protein